MRYYQNMNDYSQTKKATIKGRFRYSSRNRVTRTNWEVLKNKITKQSLSRRSSSRYRGVSAGTSAVVQSVRSVKDEFKSFTAQNINFKISLPNEFSVVSDTLRGESGAIVFQDGEAKIKIMATATRCDSGVTYCLKKESDGALKTFKESLPQMTMRRNKNVRLDTNQAQLKKDNMGRLVDLYARNYGAGQLTFFDPENGSVWIMHITDPGHATGLFKNDRDLFKVLGSLTQKSVISSKTSRTSLSNIFGTRNRSTGKSTQNKSTLAFGNSAVEAFVAKNVPFHISLPNGFELDSDTIERNMGVMSFAKGEEKVVITATENLCDDQTPRLIRRCIDAQAATLKKELKTEFPEANILQDENVQVQLVDAYHSGENSRQTSSVKEHIGKIVVLREKGKRMGYFVFAEPESGYVWKVRMDAPEHKDAFLNDVRQKTRIINSLFFEAGK